MTDIYRKLAAAVTGCDEADVSAEDRARAKIAFWEAFRQLSVLPENKHLRADETFDVEPDTLP